MKKMFMFSVALGVILMLGSIVVPSVAVAMSTEFDVSKEITEESLNSSEEVLSPEIYSVLDGIDASKIITELKNAGFLVETEYDEIQVTEKYIESVQTTIGSEYSVSNEDNVLVISSESRTRTFFGSGTTKIAFTSTSVDIYIGGMICSLIKAGFDVTSFLTSLIPVPILNSILPQIVAFAKDTILAKDQGSGVILSIKLIKNTFIPYFITIQPQETGSSVTPPDTGGNTGGNTDNPPIENVAVDTINLMFDNIELSVGDYSQLLAIITPQNATNQNVEWTSSDTSVAFVDGGGKIYANAPGVAIIKVVTKDGQKSASCRVTVTKKDIDVSAITLLPANVEMTIGDMQNLVATIEPDNAAAELNWYSLNQKVASVDENGKVRAEGEGVATIVVQVGNSSKKAYSTIIVKKADISITDLSLLPDNIELEVGGFQTLTVSFTPKDAVNKGLVWTSLNESVATVTKDGTVIAKSSGTATILVESVIGEASSTAEVTVKNKNVEVNDIIIAPLNLDLEIGASQKLVAIISPENADDKTVTWTSLNENIVSVDEEGSVTAIDEGTTTVLAQASNGRKSACQVTVKNKDIDISDLLIVPAHLELFEGTKQSLEVKILPSDATESELHWQSLNEEIASVNDLGEVEAKKEGIATILVETAGGKKTASCTVVVRKKVIKVVSISLLTKEVTLLVGESYEPQAVITPENATNKALRWSSSNEEVVAVSSTGKLVAKNKGTATIKVEAEDGNAADYLTVTVERPIVTIYRVYNPNSGNHFYTKSLGEKNFLVSIGWVDEGIGCLAPENGNPVYRVYNQNSGSHHYTLNEGEKNYLVSIGWVDEGVCWYSDINEAVPVYRAYNPNSPQGTHNYTPLLTEHLFLIMSGWKDEGISWYGVKS